MNEVVVAGIMVLAVLGIAVLYLVDRNGLL